MQLEVKTKQVEYIEFSEDQCRELNIKAGDQFSMEVGNGVIKLIPYASLDINLNELSREVLEMLVIRSVEENKTVSEVIQNVIEKFIEENADV
jgi:hypothetical protein